MLAYAAENSVDTFLEPVLELSLALLDQEAAALENDLPGTRVLLHVHKSAFAAARKSKRHIRSVHQPISGLAALYFPGVSLEPFLYLAQMPFSMLYTFHQMCA